MSISKGNEINIFELRTQSVVKTFLLDKISLPNGRVQFDVDKEFSRIFIGDSLGQGKVD